MLLPELLPELSGSISFDKRKLAYGAVGGAALIQGGRLVSQNMSGNMMLAGALLFLVGAAMIGDKVVGESHGGYVEDMDMQSKLGIGLALLLAGSLYLYQGDRMNPNVRLAFAVAAAAAGALLARANEELLSPRNIAVLSGAAVVASSVYMRTENEPLFLLGAALLVAGGAMY